MTFTSFFLLGLSFGAGPCLSSCGPLVITYIAGTGKNTLKSAFAYLLFSFSRISAYFVTGILIYFLGELVIKKLFGGISKYIFILGGGFIMLIGLLMLLGRRMEFGLCGFLFKDILKRDKKSIVLLGVIIGFLPCVPLLTVFSSAGLMSKSLLLFLLYILSFGIGTLFSPLLLLAVFAGLIPRLINKNLVTSRIFTVVCGLIMIILGIQMMGKAL